MKYTTLSAISLAIALFSTSAIAGGPPAKEGETKVSYEMSTFDEVAQKQNGGAELNAPGDMYRYTYMVDDKYINDPAYKLERAIIGVHIIDDDFVDGVDKEPEWGSITLDGKPQKWIQFPVPGHRVDEKPAMTDLDEIDSDPEQGGFPPYIFNVPELISDDGKLVLEVKNLRKDGSIKGDAPFGDFIVLRAGLHLFYVKK